MISFDVFDTLITRKTLHPNGVFLLMQEMLKQDDDFDASFINNFSNIRHSAERYAASYSGKKTATIYDIYNTIMTTTSITRECADKLMKLELFVEEKVIGSIKSTIDLMKKYLAEGERVVLISDMYLPSDIIRKILVKQDEVFKDISIYVSCECGCTKSTGELYSYVRDKEGVQYSEWIHHGDNEISDVSIPGMYGIDAIHMPLPRCVQFEKKMIESAGTLPDFTLQLFVGVARYLRNNRKLSNDTLVGCTLGGMVLYPYVDWVLENSVANGIEQLYFIARDGYLLKKIADIIVEKKGYPVITKYIYGSRKAWKVTEQEDKDMLLRYLEQEIGSPKQQFAFVDLHGTGATLSHLSRIVKDAWNIEKINAFYFDMFNMVQTETCSFRVFVAAGSINIIENLCRAPHGVTLGYKEDKGKILPVLTENLDDKWNQCGLNDYIKGVELFAEACVKVLDSLGCGYAGTQMSKRAMEICVRTPDDYTLDFIGDMYHSSEVDDLPQQYAPKLSNKDIFLLYLWRTNQSVNKFYRGENLEYSLLRLSEGQKKFYRWCDKQYYSIVGRILHLIKWTRKLLAHKKSVVVYAAGKKGKELVRNLFYDYRYKVVAWTDANYIKYKDSHYPVVSLNDALNKQYDMIVIAMNGKDSCDSVKKMLVERGIATDRIFSYDVFMSNAR